MQIVEVSEQVALILPIVILIEGIIAVIAWIAFGARGGRGARVAAWLGLVSLTLLCGSAIGFVVLYLLLFAFGSGAVVAGVIVITAFMLLMPFGWAILLRQHRTAEADGDHGADTPSTTDGSPR